MPALTVVVAADPDAPYLAPLRRIPADTTLIVSTDRQRLREAAPQADVLVSGDFRDSSPFLETFPHARRVRWVHVLSAGIEKQLSPEIVASPVPMTNGRGVFSRPLGEWAIGVMVFFAYDFPRLLHNQRERCWKQYSHEELHGQTVTIVGYGDIGQAVGCRAQAFGMRVRPIRRNHQPAELIEAIAAADYVAITAPLTPETRGLIGAAQIAAMKPSGVLINVGRGPIVDEAALLRALENEKIRGAALDVFDTEPLPAEHPFWAMENVIVSPHSADILTNSREMAVEFFLENFGRFARGEPLENIVNKHAGY
ncbi:MAG TPA: D-2-hydroxyacid dehydrogenase [Bryobacteraceae bacterium]|nr:D-2-hydroxyacid dehydrogenase [Bryobacteraceae bacterium]